MFSKLMPDYETTVFISSTAKVEYVQGVERRKVW